MLIAADLVLAAGASLEHSAAWRCGVSLGMTWGLLATMVADTAPADRGNRLGFFKSGQPDWRLLVASLVAGLLWDSPGRGIHLLRRHRLLSGDAGGVAWRPPGHDNLRRAGDQRPPPGPLRPRRLTDPEWANPFTPRPGAAIRQRRCRRGGRTPSTRIHGANCMTARPRAGRRRRDGVVMPMFIAGRAFEARGAGNARPVAVDHKLQSDFRWVTPSAKMKSSSEPAMLLLRAAGKINETAH